MSLTASSAWSTPSFALVSPLPPSTDVPGFGFSLLPRLQLSCPSVQEMKLSPSLSLVAVPLGARSLLCDSSTGSLCRLVPLQLWQQLFNLLHVVSHPGVRASQRLVSTKFVWPGLYRDVGLWAKSCLRCLRSNDGFFSLSIFSLQNKIRPPVQGSQRRNSEASQTNTNSAAIKTGGSCLGGELRT